MGSESPRPVRRARLLSLPRLVVPALAAAASCWLLALVLAPSWRQSDGSRRILAAVVYLSGAHLCHQRAERSFAIASTPMPVCARCTGLYSGAALGILLVLLRASAMPSARAARALLAAAALPTALSLVAEWGMHAPVTNGLRAVAGISLGACAAWLVGTSVAEPRGHPPGRTPFANGA